MRIWRKILRFTANTLKVDGGSWGGHLIDYWSDFEVNEQQQNRRKRETESKVRERESRELL